MTDHEADRTLRRLFAEAPLDSLPADEMFVARVTAQIARRRTVRRATWIAVLVAFLGAAIVFSPLLVAVAAYVARTPAMLIDPIQKYLASPTGWIALVLVSVFALVRLAVLVLDLEVG